jgi:hypothetical protein
MCGLSSVQLSGHGQDFKYWPLFSHLRSPSLVPFFSEWKRLLELVILGALWDTLRRSLSPTAHCITQPKGYRAASGFLQ